MLHLMRDGENRYRLIDERGREVGWIRGRAVRFFGLTSEEHVMQAARRAWRALQDVLRREFADRAGPPEGDRLRLVHDGAYEWISDGTIPIARLFRPKPFQESSFAIELVVPAYADDRLAISAVHAMADALRQETILAQPAAPAVAGRAPLDAA